MKPPALRFEAHRIEVHGKVVIENIDSVARMEEFTRRCENKEDGVYFDGDLMLTWEEVKKMKSRIPPNPREYAEEMAEHIRRAKEEPDGDSN